MSALQQKFTTINQTNNGQPSHYIKTNMLSLQILRTQMPQGIEFPRFEKYYGKGDPISHVSAYTILCSDFIFEDNLLTKLFPRSLNDTALEWFFSLPNNSISSFNGLVDTFCNHFHIHMGSKMTLTDLMTCKQKVDEKVTNFITHYQMLYSLINIKILDFDLQKMCIASLQRKIQTKLEMLKFPSFT